MNDFFSDPKAILLGLLGAIMSLLTWMGKGALRRIERLEGEAARKEDIKQLRTDMERRHAENSGKLDNIESAVTGTHRRIDDLYRDLIGGNGGR